MATGFEAHGGALVDCLVDAAHGERLKGESLDYPSVTLGRRQLCDLELLCNGGFSPLTGFLGKDDYARVLAEQRLVDGTLWPLPITLDVAAEWAEPLAPGSRVALRDEEGFMLAVMTVEELYRPSPAAEAEQVYGTTSTAHPEVARLLESGERVYLAGPVEAVQLPHHYDFETLRYSPRELRQHFDALGWRNVVAFHTSRPMHQAQRAICLEAARRADGHVLVHPVVGIARPGDVSYYTRIKCYRALEPHFPRNTAMLALLPMAMRMAGPREALWHAIVRRNYGCSHMIMANDHASPPRRIESLRDLHAPTAACEHVRQHADEIGIELLEFERRVYVPKRRAYVPVSEAQDESPVEFTTEDFNRHLALEQPLPDWYTYPEVIETLYASQPPRRSAGVTLFFTGLSGAGKSTIAKLVYGKLIEHGNRPVTLLDGDVVRRNLSSELGFSKAHRDLNVRRIGFVAAQITKNRGVAICAPIAPYATTRKAVRELVSEQGAFIEVHVSTPLEVCEARDRKGLYAKARRGIIPEFTGVSDPYEVPETAELRIDTSELSPVQAGEQVLHYLMHHGYLELADESGGV